MKIKSLNQEYKAFIFALLIFLCGIFFLQMQGVMVKFTGQNYSSFQLAFYRNIFGIIPIILFYYLSFSKSGNIKVKSLFIKVPMLWILIIRGFLLAFAQLCLFTSFIYLNLATATSLSSLTPFVVAILSMPILGIKLNYWKLFAVIIGSAGAFIIIKPGSDIFSLYSILPLGASFGYGLNLVLLRLFPKELPTINIQFYSQISAIFFSLLFILFTFEFIQIFSFLDFILIFIMGFFGAAGVYLVMLSYRMTNHINLGPFHYFNILFAFILGLLIFDETPYDEIFPGIMLIILASLLIFWREKKNG